MFLYHKLSNGKKMGGKLHKRFRSREHVVAKVMKVKGVHQHCRCILPVCKVCSSSDACLLNLFQRKCKPCYRKFYHKEQVKMLFLMISSVYNSLIAITWKITVVDKMTNCFHPSKNSDQETIHLCLHIDIWCWLWWICTLLVHLCFHITYLIANFSLTLILYIVAVASPLQYLFQVYAM